MTTAIDTDRQSAARVEHERFVRLLPLLDGPCRQKAAQQVIAALIPHVRPRYRVRARLVCWTTGLKRNRYNSWRSTLHERALKPLCRALRKEGTVAERALVSVADGAFADGCNHAQHVLGRPAVLDLILAAAKPRLHPVYRALLVERFASTPPDDFHRAGLFKLTETLSTYTRHGPVWPGWLLAHLAEPLEAEPTGSDLQALAAAALTEAQAEIAWTLTTRDDTLVATAIELAQQLA
jgi:hypothetical protein